MGNFTRMMCATSCHYFALSFSPSSMISLFLVFHVWRLSYSAVSLHDNMCAYSPMVDLIMSLVPSPDVHGSQCHRHGRFCQYSCVDVGYGSVHVTMPFKWLIRGFLKENVLFAVCFSPLCCSLYLHPPFSLFSLPLPAPCCSLLSAPLVFHLVSFLSVLHRERRTGRNTRWPGSWSCVLTTSVTSTFRISNPKIWSHVKEPWPSTS